MKWKYLKYFKQTNLILKIILYLFKKKNNEIILSDWCLFQKLDSSKYFFGHALDFARMKNKTSKSQNPLSYVRIDLENKKEIGVLCHWYTFSRNKPSYLVSIRMEVYGC